MDLKYRGPLPGDVLFFRGSSRHGRLIQWRQKQLGFDNADIIHSAIMVDSRNLIEARTARGVVYINLSKNAQKFREYATAEVLRHPALLPAERFGAGLLEASYFYYKQGYDWWGALDRGRFNNRRKICSSLVRLILDDIGHLGDVMPMHANLQIFPAELFLALKNKGFVHIGSYEIPGNHYFKNNDNYNFLKVMEINHRIADANSNFSALYSNTMVNIQERWIEMVAKSDPNIQLAQLFSGTLLGSGSVIDQVAAALTSLGENLEALHQQTSEKVIHWTSRSRFRRNLELSRRGVQKNIDLVIKLLSTIHKLILNFQRRVITNKGDDVQDENVAPCRALLLLRILTNATDLDEAGASCRRFVDCYSQLVLPCAFNSANAEGHSIPLLVSDIENELLSMLDLTKDLEQREPGRFNILKEISEDIFMNFQTEPLKILELDPATI